MEIDKKLTQKKATVTKEKTTPQKKERKPRRTKNNPTAKSDRERVFEVLELVESEGLSVLKACEKVNFKRSHFFRTIDLDSDLLDKYARARERRSELLLEEIVDISDEMDDDKTPFYGETRIKRANLRIETRIKYLKTLFPNKYGDKLNLNHSGEVKIETITGMKIVNNTEETKSKENGN